MRAIGPTNMKLCRRQSRLTLALWRAGCGPLWTRRKNLRAPCRSARKGCCSWKTARRFSLIRSGLKPIPSLLESAMGSGLVHPKSAAPCWSDTSPRSRPRQKRHARADVTYIAWRPGGRKSEPREPRRHLRLAVAGQADPGPQPPIVGKHRADQAAEGGEQEAVRLGEPQQRE